jgi:WXG100 family type VII secretion target
MATVISAREGALAKGASAVSAASVEIRQITSSIQAELDALRPAWTGTAASSYHALMEQWSEDAVALAQVLIEFEAALRGTEQDLAAGESSRTAVIGGLTALMGGE